MYLNDKQKQEISKEIENLELQSSAELVAVVTKRSASYKYISSLLSITFLAFLSIILVIFTQISSLFLLEIQLFTFMILYLVFEKFDNIIMLLLPKTYKYNISKEYANKQFSNLGLNRTKTNQALMFFVSLDEKYVEIIADETISDKISNEYFQEIVNEFIIDVKNNQLSNGYLKAIHACSHKLIQEFPIQANDKNELTNDVIELG
jgi:putative membrane protein